MSRTYNDRIRWLQKHYHTGKELYLSLSKTDKCKVDNWYRQTPSWYNLLFNTSKRRRKERDLLAVITLIHNDYVWPLDKKTHSYYW